MTTTAAPNPEPRIPNFWCHPMVLLDHVGLVHRAVFVVGSTDLDAISEVLTQHLGVRFNVVPVDQAHTRGSLLVADDCGATTSWRHDARRLIRSAFGERAGSCHDCQEDDFCWLSLDVTAALMAQGRGSIVVPVWMPTKACATAAARGRRVEYVVEARPLDHLPDGPWVWGLPVSVTWWLDLFARDPEAFRRISQGDRDVRHTAVGDRGHFTALVAAACEEVAAWVAAGIQVAGRRWADVAGGDGYYALALLWHGASSVTLVNDRRPHAQALPVLEEAGVKVVVADARTVDLSDAESLLILYGGHGLVEDLVVTHAQRLITHAFPRDWTNYERWDGDKVKLPGLVLGISEDYAYLRAAFASEGPEERIVMRRLEPGEYALPF